MELNKYLLQPGSLSVSELRERIGAKSDAQIRQWRHAYGKRKPDPVYAVRIEAATEGKVARWDLRSGDWFEIWPELIGLQDAPREHKGKAITAPEGLVTSKRRRRSTHPNKE
jgi:DNA-binding transcriptional regulator YdaS (Cro superfamily)